MTDLYGTDGLPLPTADEMAELDRRAHQSLGVPERLLMESAGRAVAMVVDHLFPRGRVAGAVGGGHNGGDTLIALRVLRCWGRQVVAVQASRELPEDVLRHGWDLSIGGPEEAARVFGGADVLLDGVLGTGARGAPRAPQSDVIDALNAAERPIVAVDGPSGIDFTTGAVPGPCVDADVTVALGYPKRGCLFQPGRSRCGRLLVAEIGFPPAPREAYTAEVLTPAWARARLPPRPPGAHKGDAGYLLVLAGSVGMGGAAALAARAALKAGAGLVRVASDSANRHILQSLVPEAVFVDADDAAALDGACEWAHAVVAGPGLGHTEKSWSRLETVLEASGAKPVLLDADALNLLAKREDSLVRHAGERPVAITPHPGEMSRLSGLAVEEIRRDPVGVGARAAARWGAAVLLEGAPSIVAAPDVPTLVNSSGSAVVATGGSGDVLTGACGAMLAAGLSPREALGVGLYYAGRAAELLAGRRGTTAADLLEALPAAFLHWGAESPPEGLPFVVFDQPPRQ